MGPSSDQGSRAPFEALKRDGLPPWVEPLLRALEISNDDPTKPFASLASVGIDGEPRCRMVVVRGCVGDSSPDLPETAPESLWMVTDRRSAKYLEFEREPRAELVWYFQEAREQFRFSGIMRLCDAADSEWRRGAYRSLSPATRIQFRWPDPGMPRRIEQNIEYQFVPESADLAEPPVNFAVLVLHVEAVDHLVLRGNPQNRYAYSKQDDGQWTRLEINP